MYTYTFYLQNKVYELHNPDLTTEDGSERSASNGNKQRLLSKRLPTGSEVHYIGHELTDVYVISSARYTLYGCI